MTQIPSSAREDIAATLKTCLLASIGSTLDTTLISDDTNLFDLGVDSMNMTELVLRIEERFGLMLMPEELSADLFTRYSRLVDFVQRKLTHE